MLKIISAQYGANGRYVNITSQLNSYISNGILNCTISNSIAGDPCYGTVKQCVCIYQINNRQQQSITVSENQNLYIDGSATDAYYNSFLI